MARTVFEWHAKEYEFEEKSADWYWALGILATALAIVCVLFGNVLLGLVIVAAAAAVALQAAKHPRIHRFVLDDRGLAIDDAFYPYDSMTAYALIEYLEGNLPPALSVKTTSIFTPHLLIPLTGVNADAMHEYLLQHVPHEPHELPFSYRVAALFRF
jgi:hypothetical protein